MRPGTTVLAAAVAAVATTWALGTACALAAPAASPVAAPTRADGASAASPREWRVGDLLLVTELAPGIWRHTSWRTMDGQRVPANGLIVRDGDEIVVVDTAWGEEPTVALLDWVQAELGEPVARVVATHSHEDRVGAPRTLAARGIPLLVHPATAALAAKRGVTTTEPLAGFATSDAVRVGTLEVFHPGPAHASDNVVVWIPSARVLFGGCAVKSADARDLGYVGEADLARWPAAMRALQRRHPEVAIVVPGHGDPGDASLVQHTIDLVAAANAARDRTSAGDADAARRGEVP